MKIKYHFLKSRAESVSKRLDKTDYLIGVLYGVGIKIHVNLDDREDICRGFATGVFCGRAPAVLLCSF